MTGPNQAPGAQPDIGSIEPPVANAVPAEEGIAKPPIPGVAPDEAPTATEAGKNGQEPALLGTQGRQDVSTTVASDLRKDGLHAEVERLEAEGGPMVIRTGTARDIGSRAASQAFGQQPGMRVPIRPDVGPKAIFSPQIRMRR